MKKYLIALALWATTLVAHAADPVVSLSVSRTYGTAPLCVHFDATGTTDADVTYPFSGLIYKWTFGDVDPGVWAYGANGAWSKNMERGPVAGHCYETPGTYTARLQVCDETRCIGTTQSIRVDSPTVDNSALTPTGSNFTGTNTTCFYTDTVGTGCPAGATQTLQSNFNTAVTACVASGKRCLFKRGNTFTSATSNTLSTTITTAQIGAYGTGANPKVTGDSIDFIYLSGTISDLVVMDIDFYGAGDSTTQGSMIKFAANTTNVTALRVGCYDHGGCYTTLGNADTNRATGLFVVDGIGQRWSKGNFTYMAIKDGAFMGNRLSEIRWGPFGDDVGSPACALCTSEHGMRFQYIRKSIVAHNYCNDCSSSAKHQMTFRGPPRNTTGAVESDDRDSNRFIIADNYFDSGSRSTQQITVMPASGTQCHWVRDVIIERNLFKNIKSGNTAITLEGQRMWVRNNLFYTSGGSGEASILMSSDNNDTCSGDSYDLVNTANKLPQRQLYFIENNTTYAAAAVNNFNPVTIAGVTHSVINNQIYNNLAYTPGWNSANTYNNPAESGTTTNTVKATNTIEADLSTNPFVTTPSSPLTFRASPSAYAATGGTNTFPAIAEDFFFCRDKTSGAYRVGATVPASRAQCAGGAK